MANMDALEDRGLTEDDWQAIADALQGTPPNAEEWAVYLRKQDESQGG